jgi:hypothetical protein
MSKLLAFLAIFVFIESAYPCVCNYPYFDEQFENSSLIFTGKVKLIEPAGNNQNRVKFDLIKLFKGVPGKTLEIRTAETTDACGFSFEMGQQYLVYAAGKDFEVNLCSRTRLINEASEDLARLERGTPKTPARDPFVEMTGDQVRLNSSSIPKELNITNAVIVGITKKSDGYVALVRATNNRVYFLKVGDKLSDGVVLKIDIKAVTFRQYKGYRSVLVKKELRPFPE